jgi:hypothetical protein
METVQEVVGALAIGASIIGWFWIAIMAFSEGDTFWGIGCLIVSPLCILYGIMNFQALKIPLFLVVGGLVARIAFAALG